MCVILQHRWVKDASERYHNVKNGREIRNCSSDEHDLINRTNVNMVSEHVKCQFNNVAKEMEY